MVSLLGGGLRNAVGNVGEDGHTHKQAKSIGLEDPVLCEIVSPWSLHDHGSEGVGVSHLGHFV